MKALFLGGDKRQLEIINNLKKKNIRIDTLGYKNIDIVGTRNLEMKDIKLSEYDLIFFPPFMFKVMMNGCHFKYSFLS